MEGMECDHVLVRKASFAFSGLHNTGSELVSDSRTRHAVPVATRLIPADHVQGTIIVKVVLCDQLAVKQLNSSSRTYPLPSALARSKHSLPSRTSSPSQIARASKSVGGVNCTSPRAAWPTNQKYTRTSGSFSIESLSSSIRKPLGLADDPSKMGREASAPVIPC